MKLGIDYGGVCSVHIASYENKDSKGELEPINVEGCLETLLRLKEKGHSLHLISFCGKKRALETREYILKTFPDLFDTLHFVKDRKFKSSVCDYLGIDYMIDDRADILKTINCGTILFGGSNQEDNTDFVSNNTDFVANACCETWKDVESYLNDVDLVPTEHKIGCKTSINISKMCY